jgi:hypothetical protein
MCPAKQATLLCWGQVRKSHVLNTPQAMPDQYLFFWGGGWGYGPRSRTDGRTAALRLIVQKMINFLIFPSNGAQVEWKWQGKTEVLGEKPVPVPLCPPQIAHVLIRDLTRTSAVGGRQLTSWAMARPARLLTVSPPLYLPNFPSILLKICLHEYWYL